ncbi:YozE family protein [Bacillus solimangrovi]|uniref:UPF0346 protein BFG57_02065 n=1 Tax=Bacillus solimangrovi TaxID=1305675 RepID=A0A1E5LFE7_9BACI|nr:YozE family protein [Bacillus solimangrovi]OEH92801.1 hypothetical protein BFG57_02065 [Bacillus solimangrovi]
MKKPFYQFVMKYRPKGSQKNYQEFAQQLFVDGEFPKQSTSYHEISAYLEENSPSLDAISIFDEMWELYEME